VAISDSLGQIQADMWCAGRLAGARTIGARERWRLPVHGLGERSAGGSQSLAAAMYQAVCVPVVTVAYRLAQDFNSFKPRSVTVQNTPIHEEQQAADESSITRQACRHCCSQIITFLVMSMFELNSEQQTAKCLDEELGPRLCKSKKFLNQLTVG
jgi:hypothetical protein